MLGQKKASEDDPQIVIQQRERYQEDENEEENRAAEQVCACRVHAANTSGHGLDHSIRIAANQCKDIADLQLTLVCLTTGTLTYQMLIATNQAGAYMALCCLCCCRKQSNEL
eukprot:GHRR01013787.1.p1 GENE.GHRR01013787.1~~GHRR01013787.1.p1  ORF type:complete len:112 (+),score=15.44 GHRR01013787.1:389-724(+)